MWAHSANGPGVIISQHSRGITHFIYSAKAERFSSAVDRIVPVLIRVAEFLGLFHRDFIDVRQRL